MKEKQLSRRNFLHMTGMVAAGTLLAACQPATIQGGATGGSGPVGCAGDLSLVVLAR